MPSGKKYVGCNKKEFNLRQNKTLSEVKTYSNTILGLKEKIEGFLGLLEGIDKDVLSEDKLKGLYLGVLCEKDLEKRGTGEHSKKSRMCNFLLLFI